MPHLTVEYGPGLDDGVDVAGLCRALHTVLVASDVFPTAGIRVRAYRADHAIIADDHPENQFVALTLRVGAGRTDAVLKAEGDKLFQAAQSFLRSPLSAPHFALSLDIRVGDPVLSWKDTPIHARLSDKE